MDIEAQKTKVKAEIQALQQNLQQIKNAEAQVTMQLFKKQGALEQLEELQKEEAEDDNGS